MDLSAAPLCGGCTPTTASAPGHSAWSSAPWGKKQVIALNMERACSTRQAKATKARRW